MPELMQRLFSSDGFMPHGHCYLWNPGLVWLHVISDALIAAAYTSIPFTLVYLARKRRDIPYNWMFFCFGVFIIACGATHVMEIWTLWTPTYWLSGAIKAITAAASVPTAVLLVKLVPRALAIPTAEQLSKAHEELRKSHEVLESRVQERTAELIQKNAELARERRQAAEAEMLRRAKDAAEEANTELEAFSYSVAHDLRAPLRAINGFSTMLLDDYGDKLAGPASEHLARIVGGAKRMGQIIDALLGLARLTRMEPRRESVDLTHLAQKVIEQLRATEPTRSVDFVVADGLVFDGDPQLLRVLLENLLGNAWKFTSKRSQPRIEIGREETGGTSACYIRDNGVGFDMTYVDKLFAPFRRLHSTQDYEGSGIGLATVQRIVRRHGGRVWAEGVENEGATFRFTLSAAPRAGGAQ
jgi:signal transduction histidine kinase